MTIFPKQITKDMLETHESFEPSDVGKWYVIIKGAIHFVEDGTPITF